MGALALINHAINFMAPAIWLALLMPLASRFFMKKSRSAHTIPAQIAIHFIVSFTVLTLGLVAFGNDGKMVTYLVMVLMAASSQWWMQRGSKV